MVSPREKRFNFLPFDFNKHKFTLPYGIPQNIWLNQIQNMAKRQCLNESWPQLECVNAWMITAETATFMKWGGLGMVASELPENFNTVFGGRGHKIYADSGVYVSDCSLYDDVFKPVKEYRKGCDFDYRICKFSGLKYYCQCNFYLWTFGCAEVGRAGGGYWHAFG